MLTSTCAWFCQSGRQNRAGMWGLGHLETRERWLRMSGCIAPVLIKLEQCLSTLANTDAAASCCWLWSVFMSSWCLYGAGCAGLHGAGVIDCMWSSGGYSQHKCEWIWLDLCGKFEQLDKLIVNWSQGNDLLPELRHKSDVIWIP